MRAIVTLTALMALNLALAGCTKSGEQKTSEATMSPEELLIARGRKTFTSQCTQCHNADFTKDGSLGPALSGSSRELIEARVLNAGYPAGYKPKRTTHLMPAMPYLKPDIDALAAYLGSK